MYRWTPNRLMCIILLHAVSCIKRVLKAMTPKQYGGALTRGPSTPREYNLDVAPEEAVVGNIPGFESLPGDW